MSDYISREDVGKALTTAEPVNNGNIKYKRYPPSHDEVLKRISAIPAADVVEVVRCKNCKWCHSGYCEMYDDLIPFGCANRPWEEWFCADGAKMDGET